MILAAGRGERMRPLTDTTPKPLIKANNKPLIQYHIESLAIAGFTEIIINHAYLGSQIENFLGDGRKFGVNIHYSPEVTALGTGGGIVQALPLLGSQPFLVVNSDVWCNVPFAMIQLPRGALAHLVLVKNPIHNPHGDFVLKDNYVQNPQAGEHTATFSGIGIYDPALFANYPSKNFPLTPLLRTTCKLGKVSGEYHNGYWLDVGTPARLLELEQILTKLSINQ